MKTSTNPLIRKPAPSQELQVLRRRLAESEKTIEAIQKGEVDAVFVQGNGETRVFTLEGEEHNYRILIESMNEGALLLTSEGVILYANRYFSKLIECSLAQIIGTSFLPLIISNDQKSFRHMLNANKKVNASLQVFLKVGRIRQIPVQISICTLPRTPSHPKRMGIVISEMTESHRSRERLRALTNRTIKTHEKVNSGVSYELHGRITQLLCAIQFRSQALSNKMTTKDRSLKVEANKLRLMISKTVKEVQEISQNLNSSVLDHLGLVAIIRDTSRHFEKRTGIPIQLIFTRMIKRLSPELELTLYRIFQEALKNVEMHSSALNVIVHLRRQGSCVHLSIHDNGVGVDHNKVVLRGGRKNKGLGVLSMTERALASGGGFDIKFIHRKGTKIEVRIPLPSRSASKGINLRKIPLSPQRLRGTELKK